MRQNPSFTLTTLAGIPYLLPYGQMIADHRHGIKINETGVFFWNLLSTEHTMEEVLSIGKEYFQITAADYPAFKEDITQFLHMLLAHSILLQDNTVQNTNELDVQILSIAGLVLKLVNFHAAFPEEFVPFQSTEKSTIHQTVIFSSQLPPYLGTGQLLIHNEELNILALEDYYILKLPQAKDIFEIHLSKDASQVHIYGLPTLTDEFKYDLFHALRLPFLYLAQYHGMVALHSASILYRDKAWLFSGPSGTGKSTHTNLWKDILHVPVINGDLNLLAIENGIPVVHGIPWCGTSGISNTNTYPLGGIVLLKQAPSDYIQKLHADEKQLLVCQRLISPNWTRELFCHNLHLTETITNTLLVCRLYCTKERTAMETIKEIIDQYLEDA